MDTPPLNLIVHNRLKHHLDTSGTTVNRLATQSGIPAATLRRQISNKNYTLRVLDQLCPVLDVHLPSLFRCEQ